MVQQGLGCIVLDIYKWRSYALASGPAERKQLLLLTDLLKLKAQQKHTIVAHMTTIKIPSARSLCRATERIKAASQLCQLLAPRCSNNGVTLWPRRKCLSVAQYPQIRFGK